jgi:hypothetical protein
MKIKPMSAARFNPIKAFASWNRLIPWPLTVLTLGFIFAVLGVSLAAATDRSGSSVLIILAALSILGGVAGLFVHARKQKSASEREPELPRRLNIYREYPCRIERILVDKLLKMGAHLKEQLEGRPFSVDWSSYQRLNEAAHRSLQDGDLLSSFREQCRALLGLAQTFNKNRPREEGFKPKWESTAET